MKVYALWIRGLIAINVTCKFEIYNFHGDVFKP